MSPNLRSVCLPQCQPFRLTFFCSRTCQRHFALLSLCFSSLSYRFFLFLLLFLLVCGPSSLPVPDASVPGIHSCISDPGSLLLTGIPLFILSAPCFGRHCSFVARCLPTRFLCGYHLQTFLPCLSRTHLPTHTYT